MTCAAGGASPSWVRGVAAHPAAKEGTESQAAECLGGPVLGAGETFRDPVEAPVLTPAPDQVGRDPCNTTLTCRGQDLSINSSCYNETCEVKEVTSPGGVTLLLSIRGRSIICNQSNSVSWKEDVLEMGKLKLRCSHKNGDSSQDDVQPPDWLWLVVGILGVIIVVVIILIIGLKVLQRKSTGAIALTENTVYAEVQHNSDALQTVMMEHPQTVYSVVGMQQPPPSNEQSSPSPETLPSGQPGVGNTYESVPSEMSSTKPETMG
ncbi:hypothetical protein NFI96_032174 [Prochilodus magdalenae]|nr:hypothetical protein NFI96_032174 [Prochilodus magdalenae]